MSPAELGSLPQMAKREPKLISDRGMVVAVAAKTSETLLDVRPTKLKGEELKALKERAGKAFTELQDQSQEFGLDLKAELNALAGGQASPTAMAIADLAIGTLASWRYLCMLTGVHAAKLEGATDVDRQLTQTIENSITKAAGAAVVVKDLFLSARQTALTDSTSVQLPPGTPSEARSAITALVGGPSPFEDPK